MIKWKPDSVEWTGARHGQGKPILKRHSIKGVKLEELEELAHTPWLDVPKNKRKQRKKAIVEIARREKLARKAARVANR